MKAVVFDMDGVIVDSERQWRLEEGPFLSRLLPDWRAEDSHKITGFGVLDLYHWLVREYGLKESREKFFESCGAIAEDIYARKVVLTEGVLEAFSQLKDRGVPIALASSSPKNWIDIVLKRFDLAAWFSAVVSADDVGGRGKPSPEIHLEAARRLKLSPRECLAIEDSRVGVGGAKAAGMACLGLRNGYNDDQDLSAADSIVAGFGELRASPLWKRVLTAG